ncbi:MAG: hypothetical protein K0R17_2078, partial [Rariglobus sp.]|nr:hypothetical protein [Rariglobus sp.]
AAGTPGFNAQRVIQDCLTLDELNGLIVNATEPEIARVYQLKRAKLLSAYFPVQRQMELNQTYEKALGQFLATVEQQANISSNHAKAFIGYAQAQPAFDSLKSVIQNEGLRGAVLDLVSKNKGPAAANELKANLGKADQIIGLFGTN